MSEKIIGKMSAHQLKALIIIVVFGQSVISLPRITAQIAQNDGYIVVALGTVVALVYVWAINALGAMFPTETFPQYAKKIVGRPLGFILSILLAVRLLTVAGLEVRIFSEIVQKSMLYNTPQWLTCGVLTLSAAYMARKGFLTRARLTEILIYVVIIPLFITFLSALFTADISNAMPLLITPTENLAYGALHVSLSFRFLELMLLARPFIKTDKPMKHQMLGVLIAGGMMTFVTFVVIVHFGAKETMSRIWPVFTIMDTIQFPGKFFDRQLIMSFWIVSVLVAASGALFFSAYIMRALSGRKTERVGGVSLAASVVAVYVISLLPKDIMVTYGVQTILDATLGISFMLFVPLVMLLVARIRRMGGGMNPAVAAVFIVSAFILTGCRDNIEINDRAFVDGIAIDKSKENESDGDITVAISVLDIKSFEGSNSENNGDGDEGSAKKADGKTVMDAISKLDTKTSKRLFFGHLKAIYIGAELAKDEALLLMTLDALERHRDISRKTLVVFADNAVEIISKKPPNEPSVGIYVDKFYGKAANDLTFPLNMEQLFVSLRNGQNAVIPRIADDDGIALEGAAVIRNMAFRGFLGDDETRGYNWFTKDKNGSTILVDYNGAAVSFDVLTQKKRVSFSEDFSEGDEKRLNMHVSIDVTGNISGYVFDRQAHDAGVFADIEKLVSAQIEGECDICAMVLSDIYNVDALNVAQTLKKKDYALWQKYESMSGGDWDTVVSRMKTDVKVSCTVKNAGAVK